jgi:hypothetical protein
MSRTTETLVKKLVVLATVTGLAGALAFLLVACGSGAAAGPRPAASPWQTLPAAPIAIDTGWASAWTGKQLILFGRGKAGDAVESYDPVSRTWKRLSPPAGPGYEPGYNAVWTGESALLFAPFRSRAYDPAVNTWKTLRKWVGGGIVVWTGREAIGWGGGCCGDAFGNGLAYDPATDTFRELAPSPLAPSQGPVGAWTGRELVLFSSGFNPAEAKPFPTSFARGAAYNPVTDTWRRITPLPGSALEPQGAAAWDGHEVLVAGDGASARAAFAYDPATNQRRKLATMPFGLLGARAFWTGERLLVWGGSETSRGLAYDPREDRWSVLPQAPLRGFAVALAWTGQSLIVGSGVHLAAFTPAG